MGLRGQGAPGLRAGPAGARPRPGPGRGRGAAAALLRVGAPRVDRFSPIQVEGGFEVNLPDPGGGDRELVLDDGRPIRHQGRADLLTGDEHDRYWVVSHRLVEWPARATGVPEDPDPAGPVRCPVSGHGARRRRPGRAGGRLPGPGPGTGRAGPARRGHLGYRQRRRPTPIRRPTGGPRLTRWGGGLAEGEAELEPGPGGGAGVGGDQVAALGPGQLAGDVEPETEPATRLKAGEALEDPLTLGGRDAAAL